LDFTTQTLAVHTAEITENAQVRTLTSVSDTADGLWAEERGVGTEQWSVVSVVARAERTDTPTDVL